jgi:HTH-type transcriptional regulator / antitoxin HigA
MSAVREAIDEQVYRGLVSATLPRVIHREEENERCIEQLEELTDKAKMTAEEVHLAELLSLLIEDFEEKHYKLNPAPPVAIVRELMKANGLKQADMSDVFGSASVISEVLNGKRELSKAHIQKLCQRFHVSPELFFPVNRPRTRARVKPGRRIEKEKARRANNLPARLTRA